MKMILKIFNKQGEQVNEITSTEAAEIYKHFLQVFYCREIKHAKKTIINYKYNNNYEVIQSFKNSDFIYKYFFENVII